MAICAKSKGYRQASEGHHPAVLAAVQDIGEVQGRFGAKSKLRFIWLIGDESGEWGRPLVGTGAESHEARQVGDPE